VLAWSTSKSVPACSSGPAAHFDMPTLCVVARVCVCARHTVEQRIERTKYVFAVRLKHPLQPQARIPCTQRFRFVVPPHESSALRSPRWQSAAKDTRTHSNDPPPTKTPFLVLTQAALHRDAFFLDEDKKSLHSTVPAPGSTFDPDLRGVVDPPPELVN
jgi:hypothetical protein